MFRARISRLATSGLTLAMLAALLAGIAGPLHRFDLIETRPAMLAVVAAMGLAVLAILLALLGLRATLGLDGARGRPRAILALLLAVAVLAVPAPYVWGAWSAPPIHDITTDPDDPPAFTYLREEREMAPNAVEYPGERVARAQAAAYPDVRSRDYAPDQDGRNAFRERLIDAVTAVAEAQGWIVRDVDRSDGRVEAIDVTRWFGFIDDVVVRVREHDDGFRVDVRSASRVGESDLGANAARVRAFLNALDRAVDAPESE